MSTPKAKMIQVAQRRARAVEMRLGKATYDQIAAVLGYSSRAAVAVDIKRAFEQAVSERDKNVDLLRQEELAALDRLQLSIWPMATKGDLGAIDRILKIIDKRCKLLGLDPSISMNVEVTTLDAIDRQIELLNNAIASEAVSYEWVDESDGAQTPEA